MKANHVVVWLDHSEAHIISFGREYADPPVIVHAPTPHEHQHHRAYTIGSGKAAEHPAYYDAIVAEVKSAREWLIVGPANAKLAFVKHVGKVHHDLLDHIIGVESADHPTDPQVVAFARKYFVAADRMLA